MYNAFIGIVADAVASVNVADVEVFDAMELAVKKTLPSGTATRAPASGFLAEASEPENGLVVTVVDCQTDAVFPSGNLNIIGCGLYPW